MLKKVSKVALALLIGLTAGAEAAGAIASRVITFDDAIQGLPFYRFDPDGDGLADVVFSTTDPSGFNTIGPGPNQTYIQEPGLEGTTFLTPDLRVDFLQGAINSLQFGFAQNTFSEGAEVSFSLFDRDNNLLGSRVGTGAFTSTSFGTSSFPEGLLSIDFTGEAAYGLFDFSDSTPPASPPGRYIIDNFTFEPGSATPPSGSTPNDPLLPDNIGGSTNREFIFNIVLGNGGLGRDIPIFIDPIVAVGYTYTVTGGPLFSGVEVPVLPLGQNTYTLELPGFTPFSIDAGSPVNLLAYNPTGFSTFTISDIDVSEALDPADPLAFVTGLTFTGSGSVSVTMTPITLDVPDPVQTPEPGTLVLIGASVLATGWLKRRG